MFLAFKISLLVIMILSLIAPAAMKNNKDKEYSLLVFAVALASQIVVYGLM